ncbi:MAG: hypothetical protein ACI9DF_001619 [Verrucomicrobiales bacterium]|jgi:hypothetical protein
MRPVLLLVIMALCLGPVSVVAAAPDWNANGLGPLPKQGISTFDLGDDKNQIAVGTISAPGDPNVFLLDAHSGKLIAEWEAGVRWVEKVVCGPAGVVYAVVTMSDGTAEDYPKVYVCEKGKKPVPVPVPVSAGQAEYPQSVFHWGNASNHFGGLQLCGTATGAVVIVADQVLWIAGANPEPVARGRFPRPAETVTVSAASNVSGWVAVGCAVAEGEPGLFLFAPRAAKPDWSRIATAEAASHRQLEPGIYGSPTLPDGRKEPLRQQDVPMFAPLSIAILGDGKPEGIATADYPGWQRWVRSTATFQQQNYGLRFLPEKAFVFVHDGGGKLIKRFSRNDIGLDGWVDLRFASSGRLIATPHTWTCRGLAGRARLPLEPHTSDDDVVSQTLTVDPGAAEAGRVENGPRIIADSNVLRSVNPNGAEIWSIDLEKAATPGEKPWVEKASVWPVGKGV